MLESKLRDIRKYIWVEVICHGWAKIDWDTFSKIRIEQAQVIKGTELLNGVYYNDRGFKHE